MSKAHPGKSETYVKKKQTRENRELERELHKVAMEIYKSTTTDLSINRHHLKRVKKDLVL